MAISGPPVGLAVDGGQFGEGPAAGDVDAQLAGTDTSDELGQLGRVTAIRWYVRRDRGCPAR